MLNIINKGYYKILKLFYEEKIPLYLREISKKTKLNENSTYRFLNKLEKNNILKSYKRGNLKFFELKNNYQVYTILTLFDIEKLESLSLLRCNAIKTYINSLNSPPIFIIIFGSTAKENYSKDSDIDILLITNKKIDTKDAENEASALTNIDISTFQMTFNDFKKELKLKEDYVVQSAIKTGYPVWNHISYYTFLNKNKLL